MNTEIIKKIRETRLHKHITQSEIAELLGKSPAAISDLERGKVQISAAELYLIAEFLEVPIDYFFSGLTESLLKNIYGQKDKKSSGKFLSTTNEIIKHFSKLEEFKRLLEDNQKNDKETSQETLLNYYMDLPIYILLINNLKEHAIDLKIWIENKLGLILVDDEMLEVITKPDKT
jgi:transcriptional regulator with XRE-family HTH domain